jgi:hypothetical protein
MEEWNGGRRRERLRPADDPFLLLLLLLLASGTEKEQEQEKEMWFNDLASFASFKRPCFCWRASLLFPKSK